MPVLYVTFLQSIFTYIVVRSWARGVGGVRGEGQGLGYRGRRERWGGVYLGNKAERRGGCILKMKRLCECVTVCVRGVGGGGGGSCLPR